MKKWFCALGMMLALLMSVALADGVKVTFAEKNGQINGGYDYTLKLNVSPASDKDLTVSLTCDGLDGAYSVVIPAGQKSTTLTVAFQPEGATDKSFRAVSADKTKATVSVSGMTITVKGVAAGKVNIPVVSGNGEFAAVAEINVTAS